ncbi:hypothetical protein XENOCAPTIV_028494 [Xenoophorus captivus]|uniref:Uncharacterized protein n=1 Tax=Xenoophorus captivus TaxID=1517983 RepID=A0ABV0R598_9TELE
MPAGRTQGLAAPCRGSGFQNQINVGQNLSVSRSGLCGGGGACWVLVKPPKQMFPQTGQRSAGGSCWFGFRGAACLSFTFSVVCEASSRHSEIPHMLPDTCAFLPR